MKRAKNKNKNKAFTKDIPDLLDANIDCNDFISSTMKIDHG